MSQFTEKEITRMKEVAEQNGGSLNWDLAEVLAVEFGRKQKAVVASAIRNNIPYARKEKVSTKTGEPVVTKADLVAQITESLGLPEGDLDGLDKATKIVLEKMANALS